MDVATLAAAAALAEFDAAMARIGFAQAQRDAIIESSGCRNMAMIRLLTADQVSKICKRISTRADNPIPIKTIQEQFLLLCDIGLLQNNAFNFQ
jgi:ethanolamine utilization protein EutA (predicted chaperonin)